MKKWLTYISILVFTWCYTVVYNNADWDLWARLAVGKTFFETGHVLKHDYLSYTPTKAIWVDHEWGSGVIFYFFMNHFGVVGLILLQLALVFTTIFIISKIIDIQKPESNKNYNLLLFLLAYLAMFTNINNLRCQLFTFLFFALWIYVLERVRRGEKKLLWIFPFTMIIWANLHGGFVSGLGLLAMYGVGEFLNKKDCKQYFLILIPSLFAVLINPYGFEYVKYIYQAILMPRTFIVEWKNSFIGWPWKKFFWYKLLVIISVMSTMYELISKKFNLQKIDITKYILFAVTLYLSIKHVKHQAIFVIIAVSFFYHNFYDLFEYLGGLISKKKSDILDKKILIAEYCVYFILISCGLFFILNKPLDMNVSSYSYPIDSVEFVKQNKIKGNLYTLFHWGSYTIWKLYPQNLIAIDGRYEEVYDDKVVNLAMDMLKNEKNWYTFFKKYKTDVIIMPHSAEKAHNAITLDKNWQQVFFGKNSTVFVRKEIAKKDKKDYVYTKKTSDYFNKTKFDTDISFEDTKNASNF